MALWKVNARYYALPAEIIGNDEIDRTHKRISLSDYFLAEKRLWQGERTKGMVEGQIDKSLVRLNFHNGLWFGSSRFERSFYRPALIEIYGQDQDKVERLRVELGLPEYRR